MPTHQGGGARFFGDLASTPSLSTRGYDKSKLKLPIGRPSPKARPPMPEPETYAELAASWRESVVVFGQTIPSALEDAADELDAFAASHPSVPVSALLETHELSGKSYAACKIKLCSFEKEHPNPTRSDRPHADWCPVRLASEPQQGGGA